jgi:putative intracellular protease/amidase
MTECVCLLIQGRTVTCASNIVSDVSNAGAQIQYDPAAAGGLVDAYVDHSAGKATLVTGMHPGVLRSFLTMFVGQLPLLGQRVVAGNATEE